MPGRRFGSQPRDFPLEAFELSLHFGTRPLDSWGRLILVAEDAFAVYAYRCLLVNLSTFRLHALIRINQ